MQAAAVAHTGLGKCRDGRWCRRAVLIHSQFSSCVQMRHAHVVGLVDVLEISNESFATVLEYCEGGDLDSLLRDHGVGSDNALNGIGG
eukprot:1159016-Pelagomonas_calceolata.AAC.5